MKVRAAVLNLFVAFLVVGSLVAQLTPVTSVAQEPEPVPTDPGTLQVHLNATDSGQPLGGACWSGADANGSPFSGCDDDLDGVTSFELAAGVATVTQTSAPDGYQGGASGQQTVIAGETAILTLSNAAILVEVVLPQETIEEPTVEPTAEPTEEPTTGPEENTEAKTSSSGPDTFSLAVDSPTISLALVNAFDNSPLPTDGSIAFPFYVRAFSTFHGATVTPTGTLSYMLYRGSGCNSGTIIYNSGAIPISTSDPAPSSPSREITAPGTYNWRVAYSGDANNNAFVSTCGANSFLVNKHPMSIDMEMRRETTPPDSVVMTDEEAVVRHSRVFGTSTMTGGTGTYSGTLRYNLYFNSNCDQALAFSYEVNAQAGSIQPASLPKEVSSPGRYEWQLVYSGDDFHASAMTACGDNTFHVIEDRQTVTIDIDSFERQAGPTNVGIVDEGTVASGTEMLAGVTFSGGTGSYGGVLYYHLYHDTDCTGPPLYIFGGPIPAGSERQFSIDSRAISDVGRYEWQAVYSGDDNHQPAMSTCGDATFHVTDKNITSVAITFRTPGGDIIPNLSNVTLPLTPNVQGVLTGATPDFGGEIAYWLHFGPSCDSGPFRVSQRQLTSGSIPSVDMPLWSATGGDYYIFSFRVVYLGDANNEASSSECGVFALYTKASPIISAVPQSGPTALDQSPIASGVTIPVGSWVSASASLVGASPYPDLTDSNDIGATVTYRLYPTGDCSGIWRSAVTKGLVANDPLLQGSNQVQLNDPGTYSWGVEYSGNSTNNPASACSDPFVVAETKTPTTVSIDHVRRVVGAGNEDVANGGEVPLGAEVTAQASLTGSDAMTGFVTYQIYLDSMCAGDPYAESTIPVGALSAVDPSSALTVNDPGTYRWLVGYSGDANHDPSTTDCGAHTFTVLAVSSISATVIGSGGTEVTDGATVSVHYQPFVRTVLNGVTADAGGTVTYTLFDNATCEGSPVLNEDRTVTIGAVLDSGTANLIGGKTWNWIVTYSGDEKNLGSATTCGDHTLLTPMIVGTIFNDSGGSTINTGTEIAFTFVVESVGPGVAEGVTLNFFFPLEPTPNWTIDAAASSSGCDYFAHYARCADYDLAVGETITLRITHSSDGFSGEISAGGSLSSSNAGNHFATPGTVNVVNPNLGLTKIATDPEIELGETAEFTITVTNIGTHGDAHDVVVVDTLPPGTWEVLADYRDGWDLNGNVLTIDFDTLEPQETQQLRVRRVTTEADCGTMVNSAAATASNEIPDADGDNSASATIVVNCFADIQLVKTPKDGMVNPGDTATFTLAVTNLSTAVARDVVVMDILPTGQLPSTWTVSSERDGIVTTAPYDAYLVIDIGEIAAGETVEISISKLLTKNDCGSLQNMALAMLSNELPGRTMDNMDYGSITGTCSEVMITALPKFGRVDQGDPEIFTLSVTNYGQYSTAGVEVDIVLPPGIWAVASVEEPPGSLGVNCVPIGSPNTGTCYIYEPLETGERLTIAMRKVDGASVCGTHTMSVSVSATNEAEYWRQNNQDTADITIVCEGSQSTPAQVNSTSGSAMPIDLLNHRHSIRRTA